uniref:non-specific serine/threonine protein kinase n=1 Tax=viral metagenome TaxID=1070528 RepID=A0A6C0EX01_9ZZZZ
MSNASATQQPIVFEQIDSSMVTEIPEKYKNRTLINSRYVFEKKIGSGSFGSVYRGINIISGDRVAIKFEATTTKIPTLLWESKILNHLAGIPGVVKLRYFGSESNKNIIVMDLFSRTLCEEINKLKADNSIIDASLHTRNENVNLVLQQQQQPRPHPYPQCSDNESPNIENSSINDDVNELEEKNSEYLENSPPSSHLCADINTECVDNLMKQIPSYTKDVTNYLISMIQIIKRVHDAGVVHRDIKPENFMLSLHSSEQKSGDDEKILNIIDFGLSRFYMKGEKHVINTYDKSMVGTMRYTSKHIHEGNVYSRRDDIISIMYVAIYLLKGTLTWMGLSSKKGDTRTKEELVYDKKVMTTSEELCEGLPTLFQKLLDYSYSLEFEEKPDYSYMIRQCKMLLKTL